MRSLILPLIQLGACSLAFCQTPALDAFRELRRRLSEGRETASLGASLSGFVPPVSGEAARAPAVRRFDSPTPPTQLDRVADFSRQGGPPEAPAAVPRASAEREQVAAKEPAPVDLVRTAACRNGVPPDLALALVDRESRFRNDVTGAQGEIGAAQILPATAAAYGFDAARLRSDFGYNVESGMQILRDLAGQLGGDWAAVVRAYNGGPNFGSASPEAQTQTARYAGDIESRRSRYGSRCP